MVCPVTSAILSVLKLLQIYQPCWLTLDRSISLLRSLSLSCLHAMLTEPVAGEDESSLAESSSHMGSEIGDRAPGKAKLSKGAKKKLKKRKKGDQDQPAEAATAPTEGGAAAGASSQVPKPAAAAGLGSSPSMLPAASMADARPRQEKAQGKKLGKRGGFSSEQMQLLGLMIKMVLQLTQKSRETESIEFDTYLAPAEDPIVKAMTAQGRRYSHAVQSAGHGLAAPHLYIFGSLLDAIATLTGEEQDRQNNEQYTAMKVEDRAQVIRLCKTAKIFRAEEKKVALAFGSGVAAQACKVRVLAVLGKQKDWSYKIGKPPAGYMERTLASYLEDLVE